MKNAVVLGEGFDDGVNVAAFPFGGGGMEDLGEQLFVLRRKHSDGVLKTAFGGKFAYDLEEPAQGPSRIGLLLLDRFEGFVQTSHHFSRVKNEGQELFKLLFWEARFEKALHQRTQCAGGVVDDVAQFAVLTVDVADNVDGAHRQRELCGEPGDLGDGAVDVWKFLGQGA